MIHIIGAHLKFIPSYTESIELHLIRIFDEFPISINNTPSHPPPPKSTIIHPLRRMEIPETSTNPSTQHPVKHSKSSFHSSITDRSISESP